ncbi:MAG: bifunctional oligoribonuclease/PAP phosphatase NrnA, partial [Erysipelotrichia bacterium]|nr:bifunctional oligoribonuclease/PAP phosphatase NrnA [Erysipelotrichia bacterium]
MDFTGLLNEIESHDRICLFRHEYPDCDAVGSQFGLKHWLQDNYPEKTVYALGFETCSQGSWPESDQVDESTIQNSLAIVLDTSNLARVDDMRCSEASRIIKIDHHPNREPFGALNFVYESAAATCEILASFMQNTGKIISIETANRLYCGLLTDTLCFRTSNTTAHTLAMAGY